MTTIYLIRHSKAEKVKNDSENLQTQNEMWPLSLEGVEIAKNKLDSDEFKDVDVIYSSNYTRAYETAKILADKHNINVNVVPDLGERKFGINSWSELPENFERIQFLDENYKIGTGESQKEVRERMYKSITEILNSNKGKVIAVFSHGTAISYLLNKWCNIDIVDDKMQYSYNGKVLLHNYFNYCETFKLTFDDNNNLIDIENIML